MKKILIFYVVTIFGCFIMGVVMALFVCVSRWYLFGFLIPLLLVCASVNYLFDNAYNHLLGTTLLALFGFLFFTVFLILGATHKSENASVAGLVIGLSLTLVHLLGLGLTGTSVNPARSFGPALFQDGAFSSIWVFIVAPLVGAALAAFLFNYFFKKNK